MQPHALRVQMHPHALRVHMHTHDLRVYKRPHALRVHMHDKRGGYSLRTRSALVRIHLSFREVLRPAATLF